MDSGFLLLDQVDGWGPGCLFTQLPPFSTTRGCLRTSYKIVAGFLGPVSGLCCELDSKSEK